jgi:hypothetical protein
VIHRDAGRVPAQSRKKTASAQAWQYTHSAAGGHSGLINLASGKDVVLAPASHTDIPAPIGPHGLVYAVSAHGRGKLVFVPMARLQQLAVSGLPPLPGRAGAPDRRYLRADAPRARCRQGSFPKTGSRRALCLAPAACELRNPQAADSGALGSPPGAAGGPLSCRRFNHQTRPPTATAVARIPNAIQPHGVLLVGSS